MGQFGCQRPGLQTQPNFDVRKSWEPEAIGGTDEQKAERRETGRAGRWDSRGVLSYTARCKKNPREGSSVLEGTARQGHVTSAFGATALCSPIEDSVPAIGQEIPQSRPI